jgi:hypothetical protein
MPQDGMPLKGFLRCLGERETLANLLGSKLRRGLEFPTRPLKKASSEFPRYGKAKVRALRLPSPRPKALNEGDQGDLRKIFARQELVMAGNMPHGGMSCRYENKDQDLFEILPMVSGSRAGEKLGEYQVGESGSVFCVSAPMYTCHQMEDGWEASEQRFLCNDLTIYLVALGEREFKTDAPFYVADGACAMQAFAHDAIPPVEGTARLCRERDKVSVGSDGADSRVALERGCQRGSMRGTYTARCIAVCGTFLRRDRKCVQHEKRAPDLVGSP